MPIEQMPNYAKEDPAQEENEDGKIKSGKAKGGDGWQSQQSSPTGRTRRNSLTQLRYTMQNEFLGGSSPLHSRFWWCFKHPVTRLATCLFNLLCNLYVYFGDPASFSNAKSYGTMVGDIYHGLFQPDEPGWLFARWLLMFVLGGLGTWLGIIIQQKILRDKFHLVLFGFDNGRNPNRDPLAYQDGAFLVVGACVCGIWFVGLKVYALVLTLAHVDPKHVPDSGMYGWTFAGYNLALAGLLTFIGDWWTLGSVVDQMLQAINLPEDDGHKAYASSTAKGTDARAEAAPKEGTSWKCCRLDDKGRATLRWLAAKWQPYRVLLTRLWLLIGWPPMIYFMLNYFGEIMAVLNNSGAVDEARVGRMNTWNKEWNTEYMRMLAGALVAFGNLCIVAQDWDFPNFSASDDVKIMAVNFSFIKLTMPACCKACLKSFTQACARNLPKIGLSFLLHFPALAPEVYISGKWFNYFSIIFGLVFDWAYWFMTALCFRPCDYAQLWDSETGLIYAMTDHSLQHHYAGAPAAKICPWFTDNDLLANWKNHSAVCFNHEAHGHDEVVCPRVILIETGVFTGAYTLNEENAYVWDTPSLKMWAMCIPPIVGWIGVFWVIFTHEKVTCFNYEKVLQWYEEHGEDIDGPRDEELEDGFGDEEEDYDFLHGDELAGDDRGGDAAGGSERLPKSRTAGSPTASQAVAGGGGPGQRSARNSVEKHILAARRYRDLRRGASDVSMMSEGGTHIPAKKKKSKVVGTPGRPWRKKPKATIEGGGGYKQVPLEEEEGARKTPEE